MLCECWKQIACKHMQITHGLYTGLSQKYYRCSCFEQNLKWKIFVCGRDEDKDESEIAKKKKKTAKENENQDKTTGTLQ